MSSVPDQTTSRWPASLKAGEQFPIEENAAYEFKEVVSQNVVRKILETAEDYIVSFLNGTGGSILWGIKDDRSVVGVQLNPKQRDELRRGLAGKVHNIQPSIDPSRCSWNFHTVKNAETEEHCVVEVSVGHASATDPYYNHSGEAFIRLNGVTQKLNGTKLTAWIKSRLRQPPTPAGPIEDPKLLGLAKRIRLVFEKHGLEPTHLARFFELKQATFSVNLTDLGSDSALLQWLDEEKIDWISNTFLIRREWIDGEDEQIHESFCFDKQPEHFFTTISQHLDALIYEEVHDSPLAYFIRLGVGKEWLRKGDSQIFVVIAVPLARFSNERTIYKYITDFTAYPWNYGRTQIQLRAWARLLDVNKRVHCTAYEIPYEIGHQLEDNTQHLRDLIEACLKGTKDDWHPEDYGLYPNESPIAKDVVNFPHVVDFLKRNNLPWEEVDILGQFRQQGQAKPE